MSLFPLKQCTLFKMFTVVQIFSTVKVEYYANEYPLKILKKIAYLGQS